MRKVILYLLSAVFLLVSFPTYAQIGLDTGEGSHSYSVAKKKIKKKRTKKRKRRRKKARRQRPDMSHEDLSEALRLAKRSRYREASMKLFQLSHKPRYRAQRMQIKYILGLMLYHMELNQLSVFQFIGVIRKGSGRYLKQSLEKLSLAADALGDDSLLNYAISKVKIKKFPRVHKDMLYYRIGEFQMRGKKMEAAARSFNYVSRSSSFYSKAKYLQGLAYSEADKTGQALKSFNELIAHQPPGVTRSNRVIGMMGKARVFYQMKEWDQAIEYYRSIPRDTKFWHDTLFESSWAMLRSGKFRSALSNFQSLHSPYYEDFYMPESLLLRAIVYLYICKYDEMRKVLDLFNKIYKSVYSDVSNYLKVNDSPVKYFNDVVKILNEYNQVGEDIDHNKYELPFQFVRKIIKEGDFQRSYRYIKELFKEKKRVEAMPVEWRESAIGRYAIKVLTNRISKARKKTGKQIRNHMIAMKSELRDLIEQESFIRFEMGNSVREHLKKKVIGKELPGGQIDSHRSRNFYIKDGFEYWPFRGEYWLNELGNYHYVGTHSCGP